MWWLYLGVPWFDSRSYRITLKTFTYGQIFLTLNFLGCEIPNTWNLDGLINTQQKRKKSTQVFQTVNAESILQCKGKFIHSSIIVWFSQSCWHKCVKDWKTLGPCKTPNTVCVVSESDTQGMNNKKVCKTHFAQGQVDTAFTKITRSLVTDSTSGKQQNHWNKNLVAQEEWMRRGRSKARTQRWGRMGIRGPFSFGCSYSVYAIFHLYRVTAWCLCQPREA